MSYLTSCNFILIGLYKMIKINETRKADTRTCTEIPSKMELLEDSLIHINDVKKVLYYIGEEFFRHSNHDHTKVDHIDEFYDDFVDAIKNKKDFTKGDWYQLHIKDEKHHPESFVAPDITLMDVIEYIVDNICAGKARSGKIRNMSLDPAVLEKAFKNTITYIDGITEV